MQLLLLTCHLLQPIETCGNSNRTCTPPSVRGTHNLDRNFTNFQNECCVVRVNCIKQGAS